MSTLQNDLTLEDARALCIQFAFIKKRNFFERRKYTFSNVRTRNSKIEFPVEDDIQFGLFSSGRKVGTRKEGIKKKIGKKIPIS